MSISGESIVFRIDSLLKNKDLTRADACRDAKINLRAMTDWAKKGTIPAADTLHSIARFLHTSVEYLITGVDTSGLSTKEQNLVTAFRLLDSRDQNEVVGIIQMKLKNAWIEVEENQRSKKEAAS